MPTTDKGNEFSSLQGEIGDAMHKVKEPDDENPTAIMPRGMQTLKKGLAAEVFNKGGGSRSTHLEKTL